MTYNSLKVCPKCKADSIFLPLIPAAGYDGRLFGSRSEGFCNSPVCDQLLWYYPRSGRVTRRNGGPTLADYHDNRKKQFDNLHFINIMRRDRGLSQLVEVGGFMVRPRVDSPSLFARLRRIPVEWFWYIVAVLKSPFLGKLSSPLESGDQTINEVRAERGLDPVEVDNAE